MQPKLEFFKGSLGLQLCPRIGPRRNGEVEAHAFPVGNTKLDHCGWDRNQSALHWGKL